MGVLHAPLSLCHSHYYKCHHYHHHQAYSCNQLNHLSWAYSIATITFIIIIIIFIIIIIIIIIILSIKTNTQQIQIRYGSRAHQPSLAYSDSEIIHLFLNHRDKGVDIPEV